MLIYWRKHKYHKEKRRSCVRCHCSKAAGAEVKAEKSKYMFMSWSVTLREKHRLKVFENRVLRKIPVPKRDEVTGGWRKLHKEELHNLCSRPGISLSGRSVFPMS
jgi:hypothetical protein